MYDYHRKLPNDRRSLCRKAFIGMLLLGLVSACSPHDRFLRILKYNPYLLELYRSDSIEIKTFKNGFLNPKVASTQAKVIETFANYFLRTKAKKK